MDDRRSLLGKLGMAGVIGASVACMPEPGHAQQRTGKLADRSVLEFGARGDGLTDDTDAINAATEAALDWSEEREAIIRLPAGHYRVNGTIRLRKGQHLAGDGEATVIDASQATGPTLTMGLDQQGRVDPGGAPVGASGLRFLGGTGRDAVIAVHASGFSLSHLFLSAAGTAMDIRGGDGIISDVIIDQALRGLVLNGAQNIVIQGLVTYLTNFAVSLESGTSDVIVSNAIFGYSRVASVLFAEGAEAIRSIRFAGCIFLTNESYDGFLGHVHVRSGPSEAQFAGCTFRNWPGYAVRQEAGSGAELYFDGCLFNGSPSRAGYGASSSAGGLLTGAGARFNLSNCHFRNLQRPAIDLGPQLDRLSLSGGSTHDCVGQPLAFSAPPAGDLSIRNVDGFGLRPGRGAIVLPWRGATTVWRLTGRTVDGNGAYLTLDCIVAARGGEQIVVIEALARHGSLQPAAGFGERPGGPHAIRRADSGHVCVSVEGDIRWTAESMA